MTRAYDALVLDIDGTLLDDREQVPPRTRAALDRARAQGVVVMLATGRSHGGVRDLARELELTTPSIVFNGAGLYDHEQDQLLEGKRLDRALVDDVLEYALGADLLPTVARTDGHFAREPNAREAELLKGFAVLYHVPHAELPRKDVIRLTVFSLHHTDSAALYDEVSRVAAGRPAYYTHFALAALVGFRESGAQVVDVQPACAGKAEALLYLHERYGIAAARVVAVGDATNDLPILQAAGLGVAMGNAPPEVQQVARRVIGHNDSDALAELIEELFLND
jgi:Cof subfamily protein (haloacid dehalogenase superfamily)